MLPAHLLPSSCSPHPNMFEGGERRSPQLAGLKPHLGQVCWTCSSIQFGTHPMVGRSACKTENRADNSGKACLRVWVKAQFEYVGHHSPLVLT